MKSIKAAAFAILVAMSLGASAKDVLNSGDPYTGYTVSGGGDSTVAQGFQYICPPGTERPATGTDYTYTVIVMEGVEQTKTVTLGTYECFDKERQVKVPMYKQYQQGYFVGGGKPGEGAGGNASDGAFGTAAAAAAAGVAKMGYYNPCTPNPAALCSAPPPPPKSPMFACYKAVCPWGLAH